MSTRLQVLLDDQEFADLRAVAEREGMTVSEWVRQAIRAARRRVTDVAPTRKLDAIRAAVDLSYPTADIEVMLDETERGYLSGADT